MSRATCAGARAALAILACCAALTPPPALAQATGEDFVTLRADGNGIAVLTHELRLDVRDRPLGEVVRMITDRAGLSIVFRSDLPDLDRPVTLSANGSAADALLRALRGSRLELLVSPANAQAVLVERTHASADSARADIAGVTRERGGAPVPDVLVEVVGGGRSATTDAAGRFLLRDVPAGARELRASRIGYRETTLLLDGAAGADALVEIVLEPAPTPLAAVVVTPGHFGVMQQLLDARQSLTREQLETAPQLGDDMFRAVNRLPGVSSHDLSAAFGVRGGTNRELLVRLDGLELYEPYHLKDFDNAISIIDVGAVGGADLNTGGFSAEYGNRLGGVFDMRTNAVRPGRALTSFGLSLTNLRAMTQGAFAGDRGRWLVSARRGYLDLALKLANGDQDLSPRYYDVLGKVEMQLAPGHLVSGHVLYASDRLHYQAEEDDPTLDSRYGSSYGWLNWDATLTGTLSARMVLSLGRLTWDRQGFRPRANPEGGLDVDDARRFRFAGARQEWTLEWSDDVLTRFGFDAKAVSADYDYDGARETPTAFDGQRIVIGDTVVVSAAPDGSTLSGWIAQRVRPWRWLTLELGIHADRHSWTGDDDVTPRFNFALAPAPRTTVRGAWGLYTQAQGIHELQVLDGVDGFFPAERAEHRVLGIEHALANGILLRAEAYTRGLTRIRPRFINLDNTDDEFRELTLTRMLIAPSDGTAKGIELLVARDASLGWSWSASYALASVHERIEGRDVPRERDQRHTIGLDLAWTPNPKWRLSGAWQYHTGWPRTAQSFVLEHLDDGEVFARRVYGPYNAERLPDYHRMDVRVTRHARVGRGQLDIFLDVFNLYDRENARSILRGVREIRDGRVIGFDEVDSLLPRLPSFGVTWSF